MSNIYTNLPNSESGDPNLENPLKYIETFLLKELPRNDSKQLVKDLKWQFMLDKHQSIKKQAKKIRKKKTFLTRKEREEMGILKLPKAKWDYASLLPMNASWVQYMQQNLELADRVPDCSDPEWGNFSTILAKSELIGAVVKVVRSKVPTQIGMEGIVVLETKMTFQIVTKSSQLKILVKTHSVFEIVFNKLRLTIFGKHLMTRPNERSSKKIKSQMMPDL